MKQITIKRAVEALYWIHNNAHHEVGTDYHPVTGEATHIYYRNYHEKMRVPMALTAEVGKFIRPNKRKFDTRMFALTQAGKMRVVK